MNEHQHHQHIKHTNPKSHSISNTHLTISINMNRFVTFFLVVLLFSSTTAWSVVPKTRQEFLQGMATATLATTLLPSNAAAAATDSPAVFNHQYSDPKHPNCRRIVSAKMDGTATVSGTDGTPGCPEDGSGTVWRLPGEVDGTTILVDFSAKVRYIRSCFVVCCCVLLLSVA